jgi:hypothetical protein
VFSVQFIIRGHNWVKKRIEMKKKKGSTTKDSRELLKETLPFSFSYGVKKRK